MLPFIFMTKLPFGKVYNIILILITQLTEVKNYILYITNKNSIKAKNTAILILNNV